MTIESILNAAREKEKLEKNAQKDLEKEILATIHDINKAKSSGDVVIDLALIGYKDGTLDLVPGLIKYVQAFRKKLEDHRGETILIQYTTMGSMICSGSINGSRPASYATDHGAIWGTLSKKDDILLVAKNQDRIFAKSVPYAVYINTGNEYWEYEKYSAFSHRKSKTPSKNPGNIPCVSFLNAVGHFYHGDSLFANDCDFCFGKKAEKLIDKIKKF